MFTTLHIRSAYMKTSAELRSCFNMTSGFLILSLLLIILHVMTVVTAQDGNAFIVCIGFDLLFIQCFIC